ncbi:MAG TPA: flagellin, partial [Caulobacteraceae bacterium]
MDRVTTFSAYNSVTSSLLNAESRQNQADIQVSSGKVASDLKGFGANAEALTAAQALQTRVTGYVQTATKVSSQLDAQDTALTEVSDGGQTARQA